MLAETHERPAKDSGPRAREIMHGSARAKHVVLEAVAAALTLTAFVAIAILLFGHFGRTEGRILGTTMLLAAYGSLTLPAGLLVDRGRLPKLAVTIGALAALAFSLAVVGVWWSGAPVALGKSVGTATVAAVAAAQIGVTSVRRGARDPSAVRRLYVLSSVLAVGVAVLVALGLWLEIQAQLYFRIVGALAVLDVLAVALQPILARAAKQNATFGLRLSTETRAWEVRVEAPDFATALARAVRSPGRAGERVVRVERLFEERSESDVR